MTSDFPAQYVLAILPRGRDQAMSIGAAAESLQWPRRAVEKAVQALRLDGFAICSDGSGMWIGDRADLIRCIASLQRRVVAQHVTLKALRKARERMLPVEQLPLFRDGGANAA